jgi:hypothetical protein
MPGCAQALFYNTMHGSPDSQRLQDRGAPRRIPPDLMGGASQERRTPFWRSSLIETTARPRRGIGPSGLSIGDRISLHLAYIHVSEDLGGAIVEDGFEVESTTRSIVYIYQNRTRWGQEVGAQKIDVPELGADTRDVDLGYGHPCVVGELDPPI